MSNNYMQRWVKVNDFETLMNQIISFINVEKKDSLTKVIQQTAESQRNYQSSHKYDLKKFGLTEEQIKIDCKAIYQTFLS